MCHENTTSRSISASRLGELPIVAFGQHASAGTLRFGGRRDDGAPEYKLLLLL